MLNKREALSLSISPPISSRSPSPSTSEYDETEELKMMSLVPLRLKAKKRLSKQLLMCETPRDIAWEKRRYQMMTMQEMKEKQVIKGNNECDQDLTDEDLRELKGCIELGFGFKEEEGQKLCNTLPALDLYFAVNRQLSPVSSPSSHCSPSSPAVSRGSPSSSCGSPGSDSDSLKILSPGDNPQQVKTRLRHWAQAVACSVMQSS